MTEQDRRAFLRTSAGAMALTVLPELAFGRPLRLDAPLTVGIVGAGRQGRAIMGELQKIGDVTIAAICDDDARRLASGQRRAAGAKTYDTHTAMLDAETGLDAVIVATSTHEHRVVAIDALQAGRNVYCEAPLAHTIEDAKAIAAAARQSSKVFMTGLHGRSNPVYQLARTFFRSDSVRDLVSMSAQDNKKTTWRTPASGDRERKLNWRLDPGRCAGLAGELATHQVDVMQWYTDDVPVSVSGSGAIRFHDDGRTVPDTIACTFTFPNGATMQYGATLANSYGGRYEVLRGTNASIKLAWTHGWMFKEADAPTQGWEVYANRQLFHKDEGITLIAGATQLAEQGKLKEGVGLPYASLYYALSDFLKSVGEGAPVTCTADQGLRSTVVGILANEAVTSGGTVTIDPAMLKS